MVRFVQETTSCSSPLPNSFPFITRLPYLVKCTYALLRLHFLVFAVRSGHWNMSGSEAGNLGMPAACLPHSPSPSCWLEAGGRLMMAGSFYCVDEGDSLGNGEATRQRMSGNRDNLGELAHTPCTFVYLWTWERSKPPSCWTTVCQDRFVLVAEPVSRHLQMTNAKFVISKQRPLPCILWVGVGEDHRGAEGLLLICGPPLGTSEGRKRGFS